MTRVKSSYIHGYEKEQEGEKFNRNVSIPYINIKDEKIEKYNEQIQNNFEKKAKSISSGAEIYTVFSVEYKAYIIHDILFLVVRAEIKEGTSGQRMIIKTYNFDLENKKEVSLEEALKIKGIEKDEANKKIKEEITDIQKQNEKLAEIGYELYKREYTEAEYNVENVNEFFIGENGILYIIYPYGNMSDSLTSEYDIVIF